MNDTILAAGALVWRPAAGGILMAAVSLFIIRLTGPGWLGLLAAGGAAFAVYLPIVYPMRRLLRRPLPEPEELPEANAA